MYVVFKVSLVSISNFKDLWYFPYSIHKKVKASLGNEKLIGVRLEIKDPGLME